MIKKLLSFAFFLLLGWTVLLANEQGNPLQLEVKKVDEKPQHPNSPKSPIHYPTVWVEEYNVSIELPHSDFVLNIVSGTAIIYTTTVSAESSMVELPAILSGVYELQLIHGTLCFYGYVYL